MESQSALRRLMSIDDLEQALEESKERPLWLLKHSLICPLSAEGKREFERFASGDRSGATFAIIEVQRARDVSDEVADRLATRHETPQALLIVDGGVRWHGSHWSITERALADASGTTPDSMTE